MKRVLFSLLLTMLITANVAEAGPFRGWRRWWSPSVELNGDYQPWTLFPPGQASITVVPGPAAVIPDEPATVRVIVPVADAEVSFNGQPMTATGTTRTYRTPELEVGKRYHYRLTAVWRKDGREIRTERRIDVMAGRTTIVDFTKSAVEELPAPKE